MWVNKNGKTWRIRDEVNGHTITLASGYATKTAAKDAMATLRSDALRGDALMPRGGQLTLGQWLDLWWPGYQSGLKPTAAASETSRVTNHIRPLLGHLALDEVAPMVVQTWTTDLTAGRGGRLPGGRPRRPLAPKTVHNCHGLLYVIMAGAVHAKRIRANPCADTRLPERVPFEMRFLTEPEAGRLISALPAHWRPLVLLLVSTGLRWGEACGLRVKDVDVLAGRLTVHRTAHELSGSAEIVYGTPKTARSRRTVTFVASVVGAALAGLVAGKGRDELVFTAPMGGPVRTRNFRRGWVKWVAAAGFEGLRIHDLRHTQVAWLISYGVPLSAISKRMGHASYAVTDGIYGHLLPQVDDGIMAANAAALTHVDMGDFGDEPVDLGAAIAAELVDEHDQL